MSNEQSEIIVHSDGAMSFVGHDAVKLFQAKMLASSLRLFHKTGMRPSRHITLKRMLELATQFTGLKYRNTRQGAYFAAMGVEEWANTMAAALPINRREGV